MMASTVIFWILFIIAVLFWAVLPIWRGGALWVPTYYPVVRKMLSLGKVKPGELVIDLGSGDGRIPILAAKEFGARAVGIELNFFLVWWARLRSNLLGARNARFLWKDMWSADVSKADVITMFLYDWSTPKVGEKLLRETKPSVRVVSHMWRLGNGWKIVDSDPVSKVFVYQKYWRRSSIKVK